jgi:hypothetical protein
MYADMVYLSEMRNAFYMDGVVEKLSFSIFDLFFVDLTTEDKFVDGIKQTQAAIDASPLKDNAFVYGPISIYWEVFLELDTYIWIIFAIAASIIFVVTLFIFSFDVITALITCVSCSMIVLEIYGLACAFMNFNVFVGAISLMSMGLSVEFTAHFAAACSLAKGSCSERLGTAMAHTFPALFEGSVSTFLSILPMAFHPKLFIVKYFFGIIAMVVAVGMVNGFIVMPALMALLNPVIMCLERRLPGPKAKAIDNETI